MCIRGHRQHNAYYVLQVPAQYTEMRISGLEALTVDKNLGFMNVGERCNIAGSAQTMIGSAPGLAGAHPSEAIVGRFPDGRSDAAHATESDRLSSSLYTATFPSPGMVHLTPDFPKLGSPGT